MFRGVSFRFRYSSHGVKPSWFSRRGFVDESGITLGKTLFTPAEIKSVSIREDKFVVGLAHNAVIPSSLKNIVSNGNYIVMDLYRVKKEFLKKLLDGLLSRERKEQDDTQERVQCPSCSALTPFFDNSEYTFCPYCETIFRSSMEIVSNGNFYRMCDSCNLFGSVRFQKEFYFYAYLISNRCSVNYAHLCTNCSTSLFLDMLPRNLPFIAGVPAALSIPVKSWMNRDPKLKGLSKANRLIQAKKTKRAIPVMEDMLKTYENHPGLLYNLAVGWLSNDNQTRAVEYLEKSLNACPSYEHSHLLFQRIENFIDGTF